MIKYDVIETVNPHIKYLNRSRIYLLPSLCLLQTIKQIEKVYNNINAVTVKESGGLLLFIRSNNYVRDLVDKLKLNGEYIDDYIWSKDVHVVEVRPDINYNAFLEGEYSKIYTGKQLPICFLAKSQALRILRKDPTYKDQYKEYVEKQFGVKISEKDMENHKEYDLPPCLNQEIINYS